MNYSQEIEQIENGAYQQKWRESQTPTVLKEDFEKILGLAKKMQDELKRKDEIIKEGCEECHDLFEKAGNQTHDCYSCKSLKELIEEAFSKNKWIPCSEREPDKGTFEQYQVTCMGPENKPFIAFRYWEYDHWDSFANPVIAWMPLPEPFKEGL